MPELPEVHTIANDLNKHIKGAKIIDIKIAANYNVHPSNTEFLDKLKGKTIRNVKRIAKNILVEVEDMGFIHFHLAMTGRILLREGKTLDNWTRVAFLLEIEGNQKILKFTDMRMFGKTGFYRDITSSGLDTKYGPDLINNPPKLDEFIKAIKKRKTSIKNALLDQSVVAGLGNIYATDALFLAGINPERSTATLTESETEKLLNAALTVLNEGIKYRGSTLADKMYVDIFGNSGEYQNHFKIYSKDKCPNCGSKVSVKKINGRGTYFCPNCQK